MTTGNERGVVLVFSLLVLMLLSALAGALVLSTTADAAIAANAGASHEAFYAAEAVFERTLTEVARAPDWTAVLDGTFVSSFQDGAPSGRRNLPDGTSLDLAEVVNLANCQKRARCSESDLNASIRDRPWGSRNPRWRLFASGLLSRSSPQALAGAPDIYVIALVADDPSDDDGDMGRDGVRVGTAVNPGAGILLIRTEAFGRRGAHRVVEATVARADLIARAAWEALDPATRGAPPVVFPALQILAWRDIL